MIGSTIGMQLKILAWILMFLRTTNRDRLFIFNCARVRPRLLKHLDLERLKFSTRQRPIGVFYFKFLLQWKKLRSADRWAHNDTFYVLILRNLQIHIYLDDRSNAAYDHTYKAPQLRVPQKSMTWIKDYWKVLFKQSTHLPRVTLPLTMTLVKQIHLIRFISRLLHSTQI